MSLLPILQNILDLLMPTHADRVVLSDVHFQSHSGTSFVRLQYLRVYIILSYHPIYFSHLLLLASIFGLRFLADI